MKALPTTRAAQLATPQPDEEMWLIEQWGDLGLGAESVAELTERVCFPFPLPFKPIEVGNRETVASSERPPPSAASPSRCPQPAAPTNQACRRARACQGQAQKGGREDAASLDRPCARRL